MMRKPLTSTALLLVLAVAFVLSGCSNSDPIGISGSSSSRLSGDNPATFSSPDEQVQIQARIQTTNQISRMLTFEGNPDTVIAEQNCEIVRFNGSEYAPIPFSDIHQGDSAHVWGARQQNGDVIASRIRICNQSGDPNYDVAFRDTIVTIDYEAGTFAVAGRPETIFVDSNTLIWANVEGNRYRHSLSYGESNGNTYEHGYKGQTVDTVLAITDLKVGSVVEVKADIVSETTLLAIKVKVANCDLSECVQFQDFLASVDVVTRTVTFQSQTWIGFVGQGASLISLDGEPISLEDFNAGEYVFVKGFPLEGDTLKICQMAKQAF